MSKKPIIFDIWVLTLPSPTTTCRTCRRPSRSRLKRFSKRAWVLGKHWLRFAKLIPNPAVLINTIPLLEVQASSEIENIVTTTALFRHAQLESLAPDPATKEALRYRTALRPGFDNKLFLNSRFLQLLTQESNEYKRYGAH